MLSSEISALQEHDLDLLPRSNNHLNQTNSVCWFSAIGRVGRTPAFHPCVPDLIPDVSTLNAYGCPFRQDIFPRSV